MQITVMINIK